MLQLIVIISIIFLHKTTTEEKFFASSSPQAMKHKNLQFLLLIAVFFVSTLFPTGDSDLASDRTALLAVRRALGGRPLLWNLSAATPCSWDGVVCDGNSVIELRLPGRGLTGQLPIGLGNLTELQTLSLRVNALSGPLPSDFSNLQSLRNLYLQGNSFSGEIPGFLFNMQNLVRLIISNNKFSGDIPPGFKHLKNLSTLYMENNELTGTIPELDNPFLTQFNVSNNHLNGAVPSKFSNIPASAFQGNSLCGRPLQSCNEKNGLSGGAIAGTVIGCFIVFVLIVVLLICLCRKKISPEEPERKSVPPVVTTNVVGSSDSISNEYPKGKSSLNKNLVCFGGVDKVFDLEDLLRASAEVLGKGTFGTTYKAMLEMGLSVAVKRLRDISVSEKEFREKMEVLGKMKHENLVPLKAYYYSRDEKLLIFDYMPMGSLSAILHGSREAGRSSLSWEARSRIALGASRGIRYIHSQGPSTSHGNIRSANILLNTSYGACVSDFGLAQLTNPIVIPNRHADYRAPEVTDSRKISQKADVYSFGVLLLELLTGKAPNFYGVNDETVHLPRWVESVISEEWSAEVFDVSLTKYQNVEEEMVQLLQLAMLCTSIHPDNRPSFAEVSSRIEELCRSTLQKDDTSNSTPTDMDNGLSPKFYSADSVIPTSLV